MDGDSQFEVDGCKVAMADSAHDSPFIERCLPALSEFEKYGVTELHLMVRCISNDGPECWIAWPRFFDTSRVSAGNRERLHVAYSDLSSRLEAAIEGSAHEDQSFLASVRINRRNDSRAWTIDCEITAMISEDWPGTMIELK